MVIRRRGDNRRKAVRRGSHHVCPATAAFTRAQPARVYVISYRPLPLFTPCHLGEYTAEWRRIDIGRIIRIEY